ncbi:YebC/PmpR family DNA-binding transcriptional regulator [Christensenellaceae bacterium OttesenSCG-928-K19]|nr:YebC/PmpR family DNA-binding transcriptional regulator [Christensenellaceae bacterium OttesenSCG-928-K19]
MNKKLKKGYEFLSAEIEMVPANTVTLDEAQTKQFEKMLDMLEDNDDVQNVWHNAELAEIDE